MSTVVQLFIMKNGALEGTEMVSGDRFVVGSDPSCAVVLEDASIGPRHVGVFVHDGKLAVQDLGAAGGTKVNGETISGPRYIGPREDVAVGVYTIKLKLMGAPAPRASSGAVLAGSPAPAPVVVKEPTPAPVAPRAAPAPAPAPVSAMHVPALAAKVAPRPQSQTPTARGQNVMVGLADTELTAPGSPPPPPATDSSPAMARGRSSDDDKTVVENLRKQPPPPPPPAPIVASSSLMASLEEPGPLAFKPFIDLEEEHDDDDDDGDVPWSLVQRLVRPPEGTAGKNPVIEVVHYRGEHVVDHQVITDGGKFVLGANWSRAERHERGLDKPLPLVRMKKDGVAEILQSAAVQGKLLRQGVQAELPSAGAATPLVDGELCSLRIGNERVFVRFAGVPALLWSKEDIAEAQSQRRLTTVSTAASVAFFGFFVFLSWIYGYRSKSEDIIDLEDDGFAEIIEKDLSFVEPPKPEKPPEPVKTAQPVPEKQPDPKTTPTAKTDPVPDAPPKEAPKPGLASMLANIPKVNDTASNQNLNAALSNIKGVRVPGDASGFKTSALTGKGPSSGVQIGGAAGGLATSGINSLIRNDGAAGALGGKGDRQVAGKVTTQPRLSQTKGTGELSKDEIQRVINSHVGEIQYCYEKQLRTNSGLAGRVVLEWTVTPSGSISVVKVATSSLASNDATKCMMDRVKTWKFPKPRGNGAVTIVYPFVFNTI
ncbi:MAG: AgmX/PglI C-terminal domain-containing protein [Deltaproteobacteria bacterium]|nr:AgmX/PglI C-terminal domain-containing protein [Deltaproteobacteria bacterium]